MTQAQTDPRVVLSFFPDLCPPGFKLPEESSAKHSAHFPEGDCAAISETVGFSSSSLFFSLADSIRKERKGS